MNIISVDDLPEKYRCQAEEKLMKQRKPTTRNTTMPKRSKYGNKKCEKNGIKFDSQKEMNRFIVLKHMLDEGEIKDLKLQHHFTLHGAFKTVEGEPIKKIEYIADFTYMKNGQFIVEDVKSEITRKNPVYVMKKKMMAHHGYYIHEI